MSPLIFLVTHRPVINVSTTVAKVVIELAHNG